jgi:hypothetical protein
MLIVSGGFVLRAIAGTVLFWISFLHAPIARRFQSGDGFWVFALDARMYFDDAVGLAHSGWHSIVFVDKTTLPSPVFIQILSIFVELFGFAVVVGLFLNLFAYLGTCAVIARIGTSQQGSISHAALFALAAISFAPSMVLWALQPLKDTLFLFLAVAFVGACALWQQTRLQADKGWVSLLLLFAMFASLYALSGIRWYFGFLIWAVSLVFFVLTAIVWDRGWKSAVVNIGVALLLSQMTLLGGSGSIPAPLAGILRPRTVVTSVAALPSEVGKILRERRRGFDETSGASTIRMGENLAKYEHRAATPVPSRTPAVKAPPGSPMPKTSTTAVRIETRRPRVIPEQEGASNPIEFVPTTTGGRLVAGLVAVALPRTIAQSTGLIRVGGGQGLWALVEMDTLVFDVALVVAILSVFRGITARRVANPTFWLVTLMTIAVTLPLAYTVNNFGTLFRLREMIYVGLCLLPVIVAAERQRTRIVVDAAAPACELEAADGSVLDRL